MNAYLDSCNSTKYNHNTRARAYSGRRSGEGFISFIYAFIGMVTCSAAVKIEKAIVAFALFLAFFGVLGGIETGSFSWFSGIILCAVISLLEYVTLNSVFKPMIKGE